MAQRPPPSAAAALYPHLRSDDPPMQQQRRSQSLADAMYRPQTKPPSSDRESLLRNLRELNARIDERMQREKRR